MRLRLASIIEEEAYLAFVSGLKPHLADQVGAHTHGDLSIAQVMAKHLDHHTTSTKGNSAPSGGSGTTCGVIVT